MDGTVTAALLGRRWSGGEALRSRVAPWVAVRRRLCVAPHGGAASTSACGGMGDVLCISYKILYCDGRPERHHFEFEKDEFKKGGWQEGWKRSETTGKREKACAAVLPICQR